MSFLSLSFFALSFYFRLRLNNQNKQTSPSILIRNWGTFHQPHSVSMFFSQKKNVAYFLITHPKQFQTDFDFYSILQQCSDACFLPIQMCHWVRGLFYFSKIYYMFFKNIIYYIYGQILPKNCLLQTLKKLSQTCSYMHDFPCSLRQRVFFLIFLFSWYFESISKHCHKNQRIDWMEAREKWRKKRELHTISLKKHVRKSLSYKYRRENKKWCQFRVHICWNRYI